MPQPGTGRARCVADDMANGREGDLKMSCVEILSLGGVSRVAQLLNLCSIRRRRRVLAERSGVSEELLLRWVEMVDASHAHGPSGQYVELLHYSSMERIREMELRSGDGPSQGSPGIQAEPK